MALQQTDSLQNKSIICLKTDKLNLSKIKNLGKNK